MRKQQSYNRLPVDKGWEKMQVLLDQNMPVAKSDKRKKWLYLSLLVLLLISLSGGVFYWYFPKEHIPPSRPSISSDRIESPLFLRSIPKTSTFEKSHSSAPTTETSTQIPPSTNKPITSVKQTILRNSDSYSNKLDDQATALSVKSKVLSTRTNKSTFSTSKKVASLVLSTESKQSSHISSSSTVVPINTLKSTISYPKKIIHTIQPTIINTPSRLSISKKPILAVHVGYTGIEQKGGWAGMSYDKKLNDRWAWTTGLEVAGLYNKNLLHTSTIRQEQFEIYPGPILPHNNPPTSTRNQAYEYQRESLNTTKTLSETLHSGIRYRWTPHTTLSIEGVLTAYQYKIAYMENFVLTDPEQINQQVNSDVLPSFTLLYPERDLKDKGVLAGLQAGISQKLFNRLHLFLHGKWLRPIVPNSKTSLDNGRVVQPNNTPYQPDLLNVSLGLSYHFTL